MLPCLVSVLLTFQIQDVLKFEKKIRRQKVNTGGKIWRPANWSGKNTAWKSFRKFPTNFFGKSQDRNVSWYGGCPCKILQVWGAVWPQRWTFLDFRLYFFPANPSVVSDFSKGVSVMEQRYQGRYSPSMLADYCWTVRRDLPQARYNDIFHCYFSVNMYYLYNIRYVQFFLGKSFARHL